MSGHDDLHRAGHSAVRWMQEIRRFKPSTISRRFSFTAGFYRTCVLGGLRQHSPAKHVRRPAVPAESPTLGFTHRQVEALLTGRPASTGPCGFAPAALPGVLGSRIFDATSADLADLGDEHGHRVPRVRGKGTKVVQVPAAASGRPGHRPGSRPAGPRAGPAQRPRRPDGPPRGRPAAAAPGPDHRPADEGPPAHAPPRLRHPRCSIPAWTSGTSTRSGPHRPRPPPQLNPGRLHLTTPHLPGSRPERRPALPVSEWRCAE